MSYSVGQVAGFAGVTVRTLHHYDEIGLLAPSERSHAGHRRYSDADLDRLQQILFYRELGFPLDEVAALLDDPDADPRAHLRRQHELLTARIEKLQKMAEAVEHAMEARTMGINLTPEEKFEVFGDKDPEAVRAKRPSSAGAARRRTPSRSAAPPATPRTTGSACRPRWPPGASGTTPSWRPVSRRPASAPWTWPRNTGSTSPQWFYECSYEIHQGLAEMYVSDERFKEFYDSMRPGLAEHLRDAIGANAARHSQGA